MSDKLPSEPIFPQPHKVALPLIDELMITEYANLAESLNFSPQALLEKRILMFLKQKGAQVYSWQDVHTFLRQKSGKDDPFIWRPLRPQDHKKCVIKGDTEGFGVYKVDDPKYHPYNKMVPYWTLYRVKEITNFFSNEKDKIQFFVSDCESTEVHHFIAVGGVGMRLIIFHHWVE